MPSTRAGTILAQEFLNDIDHEACARGARPLTEGDAMINPLVGAFTLEGAFSEEALREAYRAICLEYKGASYVRPSYKSPYFRRVAS